MKSQRSENESRRNLANGCTTGRKLSEFQNACKNGTGDCKIPSMAHRPERGGRNVCSREESPGSAPARTLPVGTPYELELLLNCCAVPCDTTRARICWLMEQRLDWDLVLTLALRHGITQLLCHSLFSQLDRSGIPSPVEAQRRRFVDRSRVNLKMTFELLRVMRHLEACQIQAVPYKGPLLAAGLYRNLALREFEDLDILVRPQDALPAAKALLTIGYHLSVDLSPRQHRAYLRTGSVYTFSNSAQMKLELHWKDRRHVSLSFDPDLFWLRLCEVSFGGAKVQTLAPEDLLLLLCEHGAKHLWQRLCWICDIDRLLRTYPQLDWELVLGQAETFGAQRMLLLGVQLASTYFGTKLPARVLSALTTDRAVHALAEQVFVQLCGSTTVGTTSRYRFAFRIRRSWACRLGYFRRLALQPALDDCIDLDVPEFMFPLYSLRRVIRLATQFVFRTEPDLSEPPPIANGERDQFTSAALL